MSLGEIPGGNLRAYYHLEDVNDSSGNSRTLTNNNSVTFASGKFNNAADFGSSGTNKGLTYATNPLSADIPTNVYVGFWFKLNSTAQTTSPVDRLLFTINTTTSNATGRQMQIRYNISGGGVLSIEGRAGASGFSFTTTPDTNWHFIYFLKLGTTSSIKMDMNPSLAASGSDSAFSGATVGIQIGNGGTLANQALAMIDEFVVSEGLYFTQPEIYKYYTQAKGRFV